VPVLVRFAQLQTETIAVNYVDFVSKESWLSALNARLMLATEGSRQTHCAMIKFLQSALTAGANPNVSFNAKKRRFQSKFRGVFMFRSSCECFKMINPTLPYSVSLTVVFGKKLVKDFLTKLFGKNDLKSTIELQVQFGCKVPSEIISKRVEKFKRSKGFSNVLILIFDYMAT